MYFPFCADHAKDDQDVTVHGTQSRKQIFSCNLSEEQDRFDGYESMENKNSEIQNLENSPPTPKALIKTEEGELFQKKRF